MDSSSAGASSSETSQRPPASRVEAPIRRDRIVGPRALLFLSCGAVALAWYLFLALAMPYRPDLVYQTRDSQGYLAASYWLFGHGGSDAVLRYRPLLYPLWLGLWRSIGENGVLLSNLVCWLGTIGFSSLAAYRLAGRRAAIAVFLVILTNISLVALTFNALTESLTVFLLAAWLFAFVSIPFRPLTAADACLIVLPMSLAAVVKPALEAQLVLVVLLLAVLRPSRPMTLGTTLGLLPVAAQLLFMWVHFHYLGISDIARINFESYVAPFAQTFPELVWVLLHNVIVGNILQVSKFVAMPWEAITFATNCVYFIGNLVLAPILGLRIWRERSERLVKAGLIYAAAVLVVLGTGIADGGGDRLVVAALPLWTVALSVLIARRHPSSGTPVASLTGTDLGASFRAPLPDPLP